jgi:hypothetical protein
MNFKFKLKFQIECGAAQLSAARTHCGPLARLGLGLGTSELLARPESWHAAGGPPAGHDSDSDGPSPGPTVTVTVTPVIAGERPGRDSLARGSDRLPGCQPLSAAAAAGPPPSRLPSRSDSELGPSHGGHTVTGRAP